MPLPQYTPHCNDDLKKIIVQDISMVDLSKWAIWGCKIIKMKIFPWTVLKILVSMHSPFCPIWRTFLPVYNQPSKTVQGKFFILMILHAHIAHLLKSTIEMSCTIILLRSSLQWGVVCSLQKTQAIAIVVYSDRDIIIRYWKTHARGQNDSCSLKSRSRQAFYSITSEQSMGSLRGHDWGHTTQHYQHHQQLFRTSTVARIFKLKTPLLTQK